MSPVVSENELIQACARAALWHTPAGFAYTLSEKRWFPAPHLVLLSEKLSALAAGEIKRLAVMMPPRHGKSELASFWFPLWLLNHDPSKRIIICSYSDDLASSFGRKIRNAALEFSDRLNFRVANDSAAANRWDTVGRNGKSTGGGVVTAGVGGPITGKGAHCLPGYSIISTEAGPMPIEELVNASSKPRVLAFEHASGKLVWRKILATRKVRARDLYELETVRGRKLQATADHRIYVQGQGYRSIASLRPGDEVTATVGSLRRMRQSQNWETAKEPALPTVLPFTGCCLHREAAIDVRRVWEGIFADCTAGQQQEEVSSSSKTQLLLPGVLEKSYCEEKPGCEDPASPGLGRHCAMRFLRKTEAKDEDEILFKELYGAVPAWCGEKEEREAYPGVPGVRGGVPEGREILLQGVCRFGTFSKDAGRGESKFPGVRCKRWESGGSSFQKDETFDGDAGRGALCRLWEALENLQNAGKIESGCASHRRGYTEQPAGEPHNSVQGLPCCAPQIVSDTVSVVRRICTGEIPVYDLQVERDSNFFADQILTHNCLLIDDPVKNSEEAHSLTYQQKAYDWYTSTAYTRLEPGAGLVVIMTRWTQQDLLGKILEKASEPWEIVKFPGIAEENDILGRKPGDALWPARYTIQDLARIKASVGSYVFSALYQQNPHPPEGAMFPRYGFKLVEAVPAGLQLVRSWDKAGTIGGDGAQSAGVLMGADGQGRFYVLDCITGRWSAHQREEIIKNTARLDELRHGPVRVWVETEPGSGGKESAENTTRNLAGFDVHTEAPTGSKEVRALPFAAAVEAGNVYLLKGPWVPEYIEELCSFPHGLKDRVDASSAAFNKLALGASLPFGWLPNKLPEAPAPQEGFINIWPTVPTEDRWSGII